MPWAEDHKAGTRQKILRSAAELFTTRGFEGVGINDVMAHAGLTRGAFYAHFDSKKSLYREAIFSAAERLKRWVDPDSEKGLSLEDIIDGYLSARHRQGEAIRCPLAFLATDVSHQDSEVQAVYGRVFEGFVRALQKHLAAGGERDAVREQALQLAVRLIGGVAIARALPDAAAAELLMSCRA